MQSGVLLCCDPHPLSLVNASDVPLSFILHLLDLLNENKQRGVRTQSAVQLAMPAFSRIRGPRAVIVPVTPLIEWERLNE